MKISLYTELGHVPAELLPGSAAVVVDTLRATTTIAVALAGGATVLPVGSVQGARRSARQLGKKALLTGERRGLRIPGFSAGNSPTELAALELAGRVVVLTTSNGTKAVERCRPARAIYCAALVNATAVAHHLAARGRDVVFVCAGRSSGLALEDVLGAGAVIAALAAAVDVEWTDSARLAERLFAARPRNRALLDECQSARYLRSIGAGSDVPYCAGLDRLDVVPLLRGGRFVDAG